MADTFIKMLLSSQLPGFDKLPLADQTKVASAFLGMPPGLAARAIGIDFQEPGFLSAVTANAAPPILSSIGEGIRAAFGPGPVSQSLIDTASDIQFTRPQLSLRQGGLSALPSVIGQNVGSTIPAALAFGASLLSDGAALPFLGPALRGLGVAGRALSTPAGQTVLFGLPSLGQGLRQIRERTGREVTPSELGQSLLASGVVGAIERLGGVERILRRGAEHEFFQPVFRNGELSTLRSLGATALHSGITEGGEELAQAPFEQLAAGLPATSVTGADLLESGAAGFIGGVVLGGAASPLALHSFNQQQAQAAREALRPDTTPALPPPPPSNGPSDTGAGITLGQQPVPQTFDTSAPGSQLGFGFPLTPDTVIHAGTDLAQGQPQQFTTPQAQDQLSLQFPPQLTLPLTGGQTFSTPQQTPEQLSLQFPPQGQQLGFQFNQAPVVGVQPDQTGQLGLPLGQGAQDILSLPSETQQRIDRIAKAKQTLPELRRNTVQDHVSDVAGALLEANVPRQAVRQIFKAAKVDKANDTRQQVVDKISQLVQKPGVGKAHASAIFKALGVTQQTQAAPQTVQEAAQAAQALGVKQGAKQATQKAKQATTKAVQATRGAKQATQKAKQATNVAKEALSTQKTIAKTRGLTDKLENLSKRQRELLGQQATEQAPANVEAARAEANAAEKELNDKRQELGRRLTELISGKKTRGVSTNVKAVIGLPVAEDAKATPAEVANRNKTRLSRVKSAIEKLPPEKQQEARELLKESLRISRQASSNAGVNTDVSEENLAELQKEVTRQSSSAEGRADNSGIETSTSKGSKTGGVGGRAKARVKTERQANTVRTRLKVTLNKSIKTVFGDKVANLSAEEKGKLVEETVKKAEEEWNSAVAKDDNVIDEAVESAIKNGEVVISITPQSKKTLKEAVKNFLNLDPAAQQWWVLAKDSAITDEARKDLVAKIIQAHVVATKSNDIVSTDFDGLVENATEEDARKLDTRQEQQSDTVTNILAKQASIAAVKAHIKKLVGGKIPNHVHVIVDPSDLSAEAQERNKFLLNQAIIARKNGRAIAFAHGRRDVVIFADRIVAYAARKKIPLRRAVLSTILHEAGVHVRLGNLGTNIISEMADLIRTWAKTEGHAMQETAKLSIRQAMHYNENTTITNEETVAFFVQNLIEHNGMLPTSLESNALKRFMQRMGRFIRSVLRKLGFNNLGQLTAQDMLDFTAGLAGIQSAHAGISFTKYNVDRHLNELIGNRIVKPNATIRLRKGETVTQAEVDVAPTIAAIVKFDKHITKRALRDIVEKSKRIFEASKAEAEKNGETLDPPIDYNAALSLINKLELEVEAPSLYKRPIGKHSLGVNQFREDTKLEDLPEDIKSKLPKEYFNKYNTLRDAMLGEDYADLVNNLTNAGVDSLVYSLKLPVEGKLTKVDYVDILDSSLVEMGELNNVESTMDTTALYMIDHGYDAVMPKGMTESSQAVRDFVDTYVPHKLRDAAFSAAMTLRDTIKKIDLGLDFTHNIIKRYRKVLPAVQDYMDFSERAAARQRHYELQVEQHAQRFLKLDTETQKKAKRILFDATWGEAWPFKPEWRTDVKDDEVSAELAQRFNALPKEAQDVVRDMFKHSDKIYNLKRQLLSQDAEELHKQRVESINKINDEKIREAMLKEEDKRFKSQMKDLERKLPRKLKGPYMPLRRRGAYAVVAVSKELRELKRIYNQKIEEARSNVEAEGGIFDRQVLMDTIKGDPEMTKLREQIASLERDANHYWVQFAPTFGQASLAAERLQKEGTFDVVDTFERQKYYQSVDFIPDSMFSLFEELLSSNPALRAMRDVLMGEIHDAYISTYQDIAAKQSALVRRRVPGFNPDEIFESFLEQGRSDAHYLANLEFGRFVWRALKEVKKQATQPGVVRGAPRDERMRVLNELVKRQSIYMTSKETLTTNTLLSFGSLYSLLSSPAFYIQNLTQPWVMSLPFMGGRFNISTAANELLAAYKQLVNDPNISIRNWPVNVEKLQSKVGREAEAIQELLDRGRIDIGIDVEIGQILDNSPLRNTLGKATFHLSRIARRVEVVNRLTTALAAYRLEFRRQVAAGVGEEKAHKLATEYANDVVLQTHGDYAKFNAPVPFHVNGLMRVITQFRKFQLIQARLLINMMRDSMNGATREEQAMMRRALFHTLGITFLATGIRGLPLWAPLAGLFALANGDDPEDLETYLRRHLGGDDPLVDLLFTGLPKVFGMDFTNRIGMAQVFNPIPFVDFDLSTRDGYARTLVAMSGPVIGGLGPRFANGFNLMYMGNYWRGIEELMPRGLRDTLRALRYSQEGITTQRGFQLMDKEELGLFDELTQAIGLPSEKLQRLQLRRHVAFEIDDHFKRISSSLRAQYWRAVKTHDSQKRRRIIREWQEMNSQRKKFNLRPRPLSGLTSVVREGRRLENRVIGGIQFTDASRMLALELATIY